MTVQSISAEERALAQGVNFDYTHRAFMPIRFTSDNGTNVSLVIKKTDRIT